MWIRQLGAIRYAGILKLPKIRLRVGHKAVPILLQKNLRLARRIIRLHAKVYSVLPDYIRLIHILTHVGRRQTAESLVHPCGIELLLVDEIVVQKGIINARDHNDSIVFLVLR